MAKAWGALVPILQKKDDAGEEHAEDQAAKNRFRQEIKELQKQVTYVNKKKKKTKSHRIKSEQVEDAMDMDDGNQADNEATGNAFMTQPTQTGGLMRDD